MHHTLVRSEPAKLRVVCQLPENLAQAGHQFFDVASYDFPGQHFNGSAHQLIPVAKR
jgi:hypothetical protein